MEKKMFRTIHVIIWCKGGLSSISATCKITTVIVLPFYVCSKLEEHGGEYYVGPHSKYRWSGCKLKTNCLI